MKHKILSLGGTTEKGYAALCAEYYSRLRTVAPVTECDLKPHPLSASPREGEIRRALEQEADAIFAQIPRQAFVVALCVEGKALTSEALAQTLSDAAGRGFSETVWIIGSSYGLSPRVKEAAHLRLSLSSLTLPHKLARLVLAEAIYRSVEIQRGTKYHK